MSKYISLENLERYDAKMQERAASFCASKEDGMWRQTEKAGAVQFWPVGNSPLEGTVEFMFKETGPASGTKGPDNPSTISGVSSIGLTVCQEEGVDEHEHSLSLGGTYYGGSIDLATGLMTVDWEYVSIDRFYSCYINSSTIRFSYNTDFDTTGHAYGQDPVGACNRFDVVPGGDTEFARQTGNTRELYVAINKSRLDVSGAADPSNPTASEWLAAGNAWLVEHPVVFVAKRAAPYTVQLTPPQIRSLPQPDKYVPRLDTVYTDAENVQIVYQKNPVRDKFEKVQAIVAQGGNV